MRFITNDGVSDAGCPLKIMIPDYAKHIPLFPGSDPVAKR